MESRHYCNEVHPKRNYVTYQIPSDGQNKDDWASQILFSFIKNSSPFQKFIMAKDLTKSFFQISTVLGSEVARGIFGIPDRYQVHSLLNNYNIDWIDRAISSPETNIPITDGEALDFLKRVKSTYAIFEIPADNIVKKIYIGFTF